jgi:hypothetical protein
MVFDKKVIRCLMLCNVKGYGAKIEVRIGFGLMLYTDC